MLNGVTEVGDGKELLKRTLFKQLNSNFTLKQYGLSVSHKRFQDYLGETPSLRHLINFYAICLKKIFLPKLTKWK